MPAQEAKRKSRKRRFDILVVPEGDGSSPLRFRTGWLKLGLLAAALFFGSVAITLAVLIFTPVVMYLPIPNPALEAKYGRQLAETQQRLNGLAEDVLLLRDYNQQLRKALGQNEPSNPVAEQKTATPPPATRPARTQEDLSRLDEMPAVEPQGSAGATSSRVTPVRLSTQAQLPMVQPVAGFVSQEFNPARHHFGMDIAAKQGTPVGAATDGFVVYAGWSYDDGNILMLSHGSGYLTVYKHNEMVLKSIGTAVRRGEIVALLGSSGQTSGGPHLHFEVWKDGIPQDPKTYLLRRVHIQ